MVSGSVIQTARARMNAYVAQWIGTRAHQEDAYLVRHFPTGTLAVVCDGMGGHQCGDVAAAAAVQAFVEDFAGANDLPVRERLLRALDAANKAVGRIFSQKGEDAYGGCTLLGVFIGGGVLRWVSVGDSPLMLWRRGHLLFLNEEHSMRSLYRQYGQFNAEEETLGHVLRSAVTGETIPLVDAPQMPFPLIPGDRIILASDGVEHVLRPGMAPAAVKLVMQPSDSHNPATALVEACRAAADSSADNVTVVTLDVE